MTQKPNKTVGVFPHRSFSETEFLSVALVTSSMPGRLRLHQNVLAHHFSLFTKQMLC